MLKITIRIGLILLAAGLVAGGWYLFASTAGASLPGGRGEFEGRPRIESSTGAAPSADGSLPAPPDGNFGGRGEHDEGGSLTALAGVAANLGKVALITALVVVVQWGWRMVGKRRRTGEAG